MKAAQGSVIIQPGVSRHLILYLLFIHTGVLLALFLVPLAVVWRLALIVLLLLHGGWCYRYFFSAHSARPLSAVIELDGRARVRLVDGIEVKAVLMPDSLMLPGLMVLRFLSIRGAGRLSFVVPDDALAMADSRHIRGVLRFIRYETSPESG